MGAARRVLPYGNLDSILQRPLFHAEGEAFPQFAERAEGCRLIDTTGRELIDWVHAGGPNLLGYRHPAVEQAIRAQLDCGPTLSMMHPLEIEVAELLTEMVPCAEKVAFGKNGSDALTAAVRTARAITGREHVLQYGMHGFHDWYVCHNPDVRGAPRALAALIHSFPYNDLGALEELFERHTGEVAAVVMEPVREELPEAGYMQALCELTHRHGALLIYDEVVTAFRLGPGGGQAYVGVEPDLACLGKAMANGMPISALVGRREVMDVVAAVAFGMTFRGETLSHAAARATLRVLSEEPVAETVAAIGERIRTSFDRDCARLAVHARLNGPPARMTVAFDECPDLSSADQQSLFVQECLKRDVFMNGNVLPCYAHDEDAIVKSEGVFGASLEVVAEAIAAPASRPRAAMATGFLETAQRANGELHVAGWLLLKDCAPDSFDVRTADGTLVPSEVVERPDVAAANAGIARAERAGFAIRLMLETLAVRDRHEFTLRAICGGRVAFLCLVVLEREHWEQPRWIGDGVIYA